MSWRKLYSQIFYRSGVRRRYELIMPAFILVGLLAFILYAGEKFARLDRGEYCELMCRINGHIDSTVLSSTRGWNVTASDYNENGCIQNLITKKYRAIWLIESWVQENRPLLKSDIGTTSICWLDLKWRRLVWPKILDHNNFIYYLIIVGIFFLYVIGFGFELIKAYNRRNIPRRFEAAKPANRRGTPFPGKSVLRRDGRG